MENTLLENNKELNTVKDSFSRVNLALTTVEKELKEKADEALRFFKEIGWNVRYKGILLEDGTMYL